MYLRERQGQQKRKEDTLDQLLGDLIKVYVLDALTAGMTHIGSQQGEQAVRILTGAAIACFQFLPKDDVITKQAVKYLERIIDIVKRIPAIKSFQQALEQMILKMKRPDKLKPTDFIQGELPPSLNAEYQQVQDKNEELADPELWNTESLCFRYYNILHQYKTTKQVWIDWLRYCKNGPVSEKDLLNIEKRCGINIAAFNK